MLVFSLLITWSDLKMKQVQTVKHHFTLFGRLWVNFPKPKWDLKNYVIYFFISVKYLSLTGGDETLQWFSPLACLWRPRAADITLTSDEAPSDHEIQTTLGVSPGTRITEQARENTWVIIGEAEKRVTAQSYLQSDSPAEVRFCPENHRLRKELGDVSGSPVCRTDDSLTQSRRHQLCHGEMMYVLFWE